MRPESKLGQLRAAMGAEDWRKATSIASKWGRLGKHRDAILSGQTAYTNPDFLRQIGKAPHLVKAAAKRALIEGWG